MKHQKDLLIFKYFSFSSLLFVCCFLFVAFLISSSFVFAQTTTPTPTPSSTKSNQLEDLNKKIQELEGKVNELHQKGETLSSQIQAMDNQIQLTEYRISATKQEILELTLDIDSATEKVENLEHSLNDVSKILLERIVATYKARGVQPIHLVISSDNVTDLFNKVNYLRIVQEHDQKLLYNAQQAKNDYANQKNIFEDKKAKIEALNSQLEEYQAQLDKDRDEKENLLEQTKGSEASYQALLAEAKAEYEAIQGIISGNTNEGLIGAVNQGDMIATIIQGSSCNSTGTHLHFTIARGTSTENPANHLKGTDINNVSGDSFSPSGSWDWPINSPVTLNQGYGNTGYAAVSGIYSFHNGIDISSSSSIVRAVKSGNLYQGSYTGSSGCRLRYVRVDHSDGDLDTLYLHVNYVN